MRRLVSSLTALEADRAAEEVFGYPPELLMEEAGIRLQDRLEALEAEGCWSPGQVAYLAGPGNNGGDALVMARHAALRGRKLAVVLYGEPASPSCRLQHARAVRLGIPVLTWPSVPAEDFLKTAVLWVDGLLGSGFTGPLRADRTEALRALEALRTAHLKPVLAVDVPSGAWAERTPVDFILNARWTLSAGPIKDFCFYPANRSGAGTLVEVPLSFPQPARSTAELLESTDLKRLVPPVGAHAHKGQRGHVALMGGAEGMTGAIVLAARAAAAAGAGLVSLGLDGPLIPLVATQVPAFQVRTYEDLTGLLPRFDAVVVGPGWGRSPDRAARLRALWDTDLPLVVDADGLAAWVELGRPPRTAPTVLTPHPGEFRRWGVGEGVEAAAAVAGSGLAVVLKGSATWIFGSGRAVWDGGEPALATGGSGDCLAGVTGAFLAAGLGAYAAACAAVALHGEAGRALAASEGWFTADRLPEALARTALACRTAPGLL